MKYRKILARIRLALLGLLILNFASCETKNKCAYCVFIDYSGSLRDAQTVCGESTIKGLISSGWDCTEF